MMSKPPVRRLQGEIHLRSGYPSVKLFDDRIRGFGGNISMATPRKWPFEWKKYPDHESWSGYPSKMSTCAHWLKPPDMVCQPESDSQVRTGYSVLRSVFANLGIVFFGNAAAALQQQRHVPLWLVRKISRAPCAWSVLWIDWSCACSKMDDDWFCNKCVCRICL